MTARFAQGEACNVTVTSTAFEGGFFDDAIQSLRILRVAALGQTILATPHGLADLWGIEPRLIGKAVLSAQPAICVSGDGYVRELSIDPRVVISGRESGSTSDISLSLSMGWKLPDGAVSHWRGRGLSVKIRNQVFVRDGRICKYCATTKGPFHIDHVVAVARGGSDEISNLVVACAGCNLAKSAMTVEAFKDKAGLN